MSQPEYTLIEEPAALEAFLEDLGRHSVIAVDTESASFHRFVDRVYLLQFSTPTITALIDPLAVDPTPLASCFADDRVEKVFHDADFDVRMLQRDFGFRVRHLFDTRIAAQLVGEPSIGLAALLEKEFGVHLSKACQRADWSMRPLTPQMLSYAASDTSHLVRLRDHLRAALESLGRSSWAEEEFVLAEASRWDPADPNEPRHLRIKGSKKLSPRQRSVLRSLFAWRESEARRLDRAEFRIVPNETLLAVAIAAPTSAGGLRGVRPLASSHRARYGEALVRAVQVGLDAEPDAAVPKPAIPDFRRDPTHQTRLDALRKVRNETAEALGLDAGVLCGRPVLEAIARAKPTTGDELRAVPGVRRWQVEVFGDALLSAVR